MMNEIAVTQKINQVVLVCGFFSSFSSTGSLLCADLVSQISRFFED